MTYTKDSPILGKGALLTHEAMSWVRDRRDNKQSWPESVNGQPFWEFIGDYVLELERLCYLIGFDFGLLFSQFCHESDDASSPIFLARGNGIGLGVTDGGDDGIAFQNGTDAARAHVIHMSEYIGVGWAKAEDKLSPYLHLDPRLDEISRAGWAGTVRTLNDLTGKWATDPRYGEKIAAKANAVLAATKGNSVATPTIYNLATDYARFGLTQAEAQRILDNRFVNRLQGTVQGRIEYLVYHIQDGTTVSSLDWWANGPGVQASSNYMVQRDGSILIVIPEQHGPWTNGDDMYPTPAGQPLVNLPGNSNIWSVTIEAEGTPADPPTNYPKQMDAIEWLTRDLVSRHPVLKPAGRRIQHADVNRIGKPNCAGVYYPAIKARTADIENESKPEPAPIWWDKDDVGGQKRPGDGAVAYAFYGEITALRNVPILASVGSDVVVHRMRKGDKAVIRGTYLQDQGPDKRPVRWAFVQYTNDPNTVGRARLSAFFPTWPTV